MRSLREHIPFGVNLGGFDRGLAMWCAAEPRPLRVFRQELRSAPPPLLSGVPHPPDVQPFARLAEPRVPHFSVDGVGIGF